MTTQTIPMTTTTLTQQKTLARSTEECLKVIAQHPEYSLHEEALQKDPYSVRNWCLYLDAVEQQQESTTESIATESTTPLHAFVARRALKALPRSYKLWKKHWEHQLLLWHSHPKSTSENGSTTTITSTKDPTRIVALFERALATLSHLPRVWIVYLQFLVSLHPNKDERNHNYHNYHNNNNQYVCTPTQLRHVMTRALQSIPVTQHETKLWPCFLQHILEPNQDSNHDTTLLPPETSYRFWNRYAELTGNQARLGQWCVQHQYYSRAAAVYQSELLQSSPYTTTATQTQELWQAYGDLCVQHSSQFEDATTWEIIFQSAIETSRTPVKHHSTSNDKDGILVVPNAHSSTHTASTAWLPGQIYTWWAAAWVRRGAFDLARDVYEQGLLTVPTVRDFTILYDAYLQLEQGLVEHAVAQFDQDEDDKGPDTDNPNKNDNDDDNDEEEDWDILVDSNTPNHTSSLTDMELALRKAEHLTQRRPLLLNAVLLRQNPMQVKEWLTRAKLYQEQDQMATATHTLEQALTIVTRPYDGTRADLLVALVQLHVQQKDWKQARTVLQRVCIDREIAMPSGPDLTTCWVTWIELELEQEQWDEGLSLARQAVAPRKDHKPNLTKSLRLWDLLLDLEESLGTVQTCKDAYHRAIDIQAATVQHILHFTAFLKEHAYFEEAFSVYEKGVELFSYPALVVIWRNYLSDFLERHAGISVERTRDLFDRCLEDCPAEDCAAFYTLAGQFEEKYGLSKRALNVYRDMCARVPTADQATAYRLYIAKTTKHLGLTATREIYQQAIETLQSDKEVSLLCIEFADMEARLQQYERARAIFVYGAQSADPRRVPEFWTAWKEFEIASGNEETFREMLRVKRSVEVAFSTTQYASISNPTAPNRMTEEEAMRMIANEEGDDADESGAAKTAVQGFVASSQQQQNSGQKRSTDAAATSISDVEERVAKLRKVTGREVEVDEDDAEIDLEDIDAEIEAAAAEGAEVAATQNDDDDEEKETTGDGSVTVKDVVTKPVPSAVLGGLADASAK